MAKPLEEIVAELEERRKIVREEERQLSAVLEALDSRWLTPDGLPPSAVNAESARLEAAGKISPLR